MIGSLALHLFHVDMVGQQRTTQQSWLYVVWEGSIFLKGGVGLCIMRLVAILERPTTARTTLCTHCILHVSGVDTAWLCTAQTYGNHCGRDRPHRMFLPLKAEMIAVSCAGMVVLLSSFLRRDNFWSAICLDALLSCGQLFVRSLCAWAVVWPCFLAWLVVWPLVSWQSVVWLCALVRSVVWFHISVQRVLRVVSCLVMHVWPLVGVQSVAWLLACVEQANPNTKSHHVGS